MRAEKTIFFGSQNQTHRIRSTPYHDPEFFRLFSDSKFSQMLNSVKMVAPCGTRKHFREIFASSLDYMGFVAPEHLSPCKSSMVLAKRETRHIRFTLGGVSLGVVFSFRWLCRSRSSTPISQTATALLVLDEAKIVVV